MARYCRRLLADEEDVQDVLQNVALRVMVTLRGRPRPGRERAWLYRIVHNEAMSLFRARRQEPTLELDDRLVDAHGDPAEVVVAKERLRQLVGDLNALGPQARRILVMTELEGRARTEVAAELDLDPDTISQTLGDARAALRRDRLGHELPCQVVRSLLGGGDGRRHRARSIRAHLRGCPGCRSWMGCAP